MRYKSFFAVSFDAADDRAALSVAEEHQRQLLDELRVEGADHPHELILERVIARDREGERDILARNRGECHSLDGG